MHAARCLPLLALLYACAGEAAKGSTAGSSSVRWAAWNYGNAPEWGQISGMVNCGPDDDSQSPINLVKADMKADDSLGPLGFFGDTADMSVQFEVSNHTFEVDQQLPLKAGLTFKGVNCNLQQVHWHSPSENVFDGQHSDMEAHHVHSCEDGKSLVLALMLKVGAENSYLSPIWEHLTDFRFGEAPVKGTLPAPYAASLPADKSYVSWTGSMTTPPCAGDVAWVMLQQPVEVSQAQLTFFRTKLSGMQGNALQVFNNVPPGVTQPWNMALGVDNRPLQPLNGRTVYKYQEAATEDAEVAKSYGRPTQGALFGAVLFCGLCLSLVVLLVVRRRRSAPVVDARELLGYSELLNERYRL